MEKKFFKPWIFSFFIVSTLACIAFIILWIYEEKTCFEFECMLVLLYSALAIIMGAFALTLGVHYFYSKRDFRNL